MHIVSRIEFSCFVAIRWGIWAQPFTGHSAKPAEQRESERQK